MLIKNLYYLIGHLTAVLFSLFCDVRDFVFPPNEQSVLFVAHPDDDMLFFHEYIKKEKPYVVCLTTAGLLRRIIPFYRAMKWYGVRCRAFDMKSKRIDQDILIKKRIRKVLRQGNFAECATHNVTGEYGHIMHQCIHKCVVESWGSTSILVPVSKDEIEKYPLEKEKYYEKDNLLRTIYKVEYPTLKKFDTWIRNEQLVHFNSNLKH